MASRFIRPIVVTALFLIMAGLLVRDHVLPFFDEGERVTVDPRMVEDAWVLDRDDTMVILFKGMPVGGMRTTAEKLETGTGPEYLFTMAGDLDAALAKGKASWAAVANRRMELQQFAATVDMPKLSPLMAGRGVGSPESINVVGLVHEGSLLIRISQGEESHYFRQTLAGPILLSEAIETSLFGMMRRKDHVYRVDVVDPFIAASSTPAFINYEGQRQLRGETVRMKELLSEDGTLTVHRFTVRLGRLRSVYDVNLSGRVVSREVSVLSAPATASAREIPALFPPIRLELADNMAMGVTHPSLRSMLPRPNVTLAEMSGALTAAPLDTRSIAPLLGQRTNSAAGSDAKDRN